MQSQTLSLCCCLALVAGIVANSVSTNKTDCPQICPLIYKPVCATDGFNLKEFPSPCNLKASNCRRERDTQSTYAETDLAWCRSEHVSDLREKLGNLKLDVDSCLKPCPMIYSPLCVTNGKVRGLVPSPCSLEAYNCALTATGVEPTELLRILRPDSC